MRQLQVLALVRHIPDMPDDLAVRGGGRLPSNARGLRIEVHNEHRERSLATRERHERLERDRLYRGWLRAPSHQQDGSDHGEHHHHRAEHVADALLQAAIAAPGRLGNAHFVIMRHFGASRDRGAAGQHGWLARMTRTRPSRLTTLNE